jgi:chorismate mutase/prephenate dehydratase
VSNIENILERVHPLAGERLTAPAGAPLTLAALRHEIDLIDEELLGLFERRMKLAAQAGTTKNAPTSPHLKLRPDREQEVQARIAALVSDEGRVAATALWREIIGWGLSCQEPLRVQLWAPIEPTGIFDAARRRFGAAAAIRSVPDPVAALDWARSGEGVAVLAVNAAHPWWTQLSRRWASLCVFDGLGGRTPTALALGCIDWSALPAGPRVVVDSGGAGEGFCPKRRRLASHDGWSLSLTHASLRPGGPEGCIGAIC